MLEGAQRKLWRWEHSVQAHWQSPGSYLFASERWFLWFPLTLLSFGILLQQQEGSLTKASPNQCRFLTQRNCPWAVSSDKLCQTWKPKQWVTCSQNSLNCGLIQSYSQALVLRLAIPKPAIIQMCKLPPEQQNPSFRVGTDGSSVHGIFCYSSIAGGRRQMELMNPRYNLSPSKSDLSCWKCLFLLFLVGLFVIMSTFPLKTNAF